MKNRIKLRNADVGLFLTACRLWRATVWMPWTVDSVALKWPGSMQLTQRTGSGL